MATFAKTCRTFADSDPVCWQCFDDEGLQDHIKAEGTVDTCSVCGKRRKSITIFDLGALMYPILKEQFAPGPYRHVFDGDDDDSGHPEQKGQPLSELIETVLGQTVPFADALEGAIDEQDPANIRDGDEPYFSDANLFVERRPYLDEHYERWRRVQEELRHSRRFFSGAAKSLFEELFEGLEQRKGQVEGGDVRDVVHTLPAGTILFRARACDSRRVLTNVVKAPAAELGPPPAEFARAGRMNAEGVSVFYGALEKETCIAELRPALQGDVAVGEFEITRSVRLLDFRMLESGYWGLEPLSYFRSDFDAQVERREFTRRLHHLVRAPVLPSQESEYLITQAMAEYLAHVREPRFDGMIFGSAQREGGANVVLFPAIFQIPKDMRGGAGLLAFRVDSLTLNRVSRIEYESSEMRYFEDRDGQLRVYDPDDRPDDDD